MTRYWKVAALVVLVVLACVNPESPRGTTGRLALRILLLGGGGTPLDSAYLLITGTKDTTVKVTPGAQVTVNNLPGPGTYTVSIEGFVGGSAAYFGQTTGVSVTAGQTTPTTVTVGPNQATAVALPAYTTNGQFTFVYSKVPMAASYVVQRDSLKTFATSHDSAVSPGTDTSVVISIPPTGPYYVRVISVDPFGKRGPPSTPLDSITTLTSCCTVTPAGAVIATAGGTQAFSASGKDPKGNVLSNVTANWTSTNTGVATVNGGTGVVTGVTTGQSTILATVGTLSGSAVVAVQPPSTTAIDVWSSVPTPAGGNFLWTVWGTGQSNIYAVGAGGTVIQFDGTSWNSVSTPAGTNQLRGVWGTSPSDVFVVGGGGTIMHYNGSSWTGLTGVGGASRLFLGVWGSSPTNVFAVADSGVIVHYNGTAWTTMTSPTTNPLWSVWGSSASDVFAVGVSNTLLHYDGTAWTTMTSPAPAGTTFWRVWGTAPNNMFAAGGSSTGVILHYDGTSWTSQTVAATTILTGLWGISATEVYACGQSGEIFLYNGSTWTKLTSGTPQNVWSLWGTNLGFVFTSGDAGFTARGVRGAPFQAFGYPNQFGGGGIVSGGFLDGNAFTLGSKIELTTFGEIVGNAPGHVQFALYTDSAGSPNHLVVATPGSAGAGGTGAIEFAAPQTQLQPGTYWIEIISDSTSTPFISTTTTAEDYVAMAYGTALPNPYPRPANSVTYGTLNYYVKGYVVP